MLRFIPLQDMGPKFGLSKLPDSAANLLLFFVQIKVHRSLQLLGRNLLPPCNQ